MPDNNKIMTSALKCPVHFLEEKRSELCKQYYLRVSQAKNALGAKNGLQSWALPALEGRGA
ncbi:hypothetical protein KY385_00035 [Candidatus Parcubacteria bacterium]|nr:hypothetical protein [Candidatus Parcubacteria bacterium]